MDSTMMTKSYSSSFNRKNGGNEGYVYKKASYKTAYNSDDYLATDKSPDQKIDQLDALLEDLRNERITTRKDTNQLTADYSKLGSDMDVDTLRKKSNYKTDYVEKTYSTAYDSQLKNAEDVLVTDYKTKKINYNDQSTLYSPYKKNEPTVSHINRDVLGSTYDTESVTLTENILPRPGTKVTTTVRTYTYEVPATPITHSTIYNHQIDNSYEGNIQLDKYKDANTHTTNHITVPQTVVYNTESYSTSNRSAAPPPSSKMIQINDQYESNTYNVNSMPRDTHSTNWSKKTMLDQVHRIEDVENIENVPRNDLEPQFKTSNAMPPTPPNQYKTNRYYLKESTNVVNKYHDVMPPSERYTTTNKHVTHNYPMNPPEERYPHDPQIPQTVIYKYSSTTTNTNVNDDRPKVITPPFPTNDGGFIPDTNPPQRVDVLMESFGNADAVDKADMITPQRKKEVETAVALNDQPQNGLSVNRAGREIYYPPGHSLKIKQEELHSGSAAGGRWAKGSGMYEYESGYKSKSKTKTGGAMVPVCLPLCCAMPCSIM